MISAFYKGGDYLGCFALARREMENTGNSASAADFLYYGANCASKLSDSETAGETTPGAEPPDAAQIEAFRQAAVARLTKLADDQQAPLSADDRSETLRIAREIKDALGDKEGARALAEKQRALLDEAAAAAPTAFAAMTFNWPRAEVYVYLDRAAELLPDLHKSVEALPNEYDPPYRLAWIHMNLGQHDKALAMAEKALALGYGPRKARIQNMIAQVHKARGDIDAERAAREAVVAIYRALPDGQKLPGALAQAEQALAALDKPAKGKK